MEAPQAMASTTFLVRYNQFGGKAELRKVNIGRDCTPEAALDDIRNCLAIDHRLVGSDKKPKADLIILRSVHRKDTNQVWEAPAGSPPEAEAGVKLAVLKSMSKVELMELARVEAVDVDSKLTRDQYAAALQKAIKRKAEQAAA
jgi:hypothetical protein